MQGSRDRDGVEVSCLHKTEQMLNIVEEKRLMTDHVFLHHGKHRWCRKN